jgi:hypothetical protein
LEDFYKKRYDATREELMDLVYFRGWMTGCLKDLSTMLDEGKITGNDYTMSRLRSIANAIEDAERNCKLNKETIAQISAKL